MSRSVIAKGFIPFIHTRLAILLGFLAVLALLEMIHNCVNINLNLHTSTAVVNFRHALASSTADAIGGETSFKSWHTFPAKKVNFACGEVRAQICYLKNNVIVTTCASTR
ncbi:hypothetical protein RAB80_017565 [Fusarium oxysporum f. sp. vasinfectum]|nr:hypothetical protein RAB80_017565 [Fusarium oxysporum f. sp. vasinfectum]KAK2922703.1 hypothetical protein FoTM2_017556 [Fusarium oxysporum f. sp. vasinfectum]